MAILLYLPLVVLTLATCIYYYFTRTFNHWKDKGVVGPDPVPIFGNIKESALRRKILGSIYKEVYDAYPDEKIVGIFRMTTPCLLIRDLDIIKHIMIKDFDIFSDRGVQFSKEGLGQNLFHADVETWRVLRNHLTPIFTSGKLKNMLYLLNERGDKLNERIEKQCNISQEQECYKLVQAYTVSAISACAFGLDVDIETSSEVTKTLRRINNDVLSANIFTELDMMYPGILSKFNTSLFPEFVNKFFYGLTRDVINKRNGVPSNRNDFMDLILEIRQKGRIHTTKGEKQFSLEINEHVIAAQTAVFYVAGYETSASTMTFMLYELAKHPDVQEKMIAEIDEVLKKHNGEISYDTIKEMVYLERVFTETLRLHPLVESLLRSAQADYKIPGTNVTIEKGTAVIISPYGVQRDEKYYPNPEKFDPDRHTPENSNNRHSCAFLPFGVGPRNCIGMRFAKLQSYVCMIKFFSKFRVSPSENTPKVIEFDPYKIVMAPKDGMPLKITRREDKIFQ